ncbi:hypothetical protein C8F01DRAFT_1137096 [Mycena amicta]|nr:hypothetical protein C8F01DRAFT_1137096 [Mycena amicta]
MLPSDILTEIFLHVVKAAASMPFPTPKSQVKAALRLSGVCAYWRQLALCIPRVWNAPMRLNVSNVSTGYLAVTKDVLERSSPHPVSITLVNGTKPISAALVNTVVLFAHRWGSIEVNFDIIPFLNTATPPTLHQLTSVTFNFSRKTRAPPPAFFLDAPRLSVVSLETSDLSKLPLPWLQLTALDLTKHEGPPLVVDIIEQCVALRDLRLNVMAWEVDNLPDASDIVALSHLKTCTLEIVQEDDASTFTPFFARFAFPALQSLNILIDGDDDVSHLGNAFAPFLGRCPNLEGLKIGFCGMESDTLGNILLNIPSLKAFELRCCRNCVNNAFFERLTYRETDLAPVAPFLQDVRLVSVEEDYDEDCIREMIRSRWWSDEALKALPTPPRVARWSNISISADDCDSRECSEDLEATMAELRAQGLHLYIALKETGE